MKRLEGPIRLICKGCGREMDYPRDIDPSLPNVVKTIVTSACPKCDRGDFGSERYLDVLGRELDFETWKPFNDDTAVR
jgi:hypothetical protein